jgi:hypothetical protein
MLFKEPGSTGSVLRSSNSRVSEFSLASKRAQFCEPFVKDQVIQQWKRGDAVICIACTRAVLISYVLWSVYEWGMLGLESQNCSGIRVSVLSGPWANM